MQHVNLTVPLSFGDIAKSSTNRHQQLTLRRGEHGLTTVHVQVLDENGVPLNVAGMSARWCVMSESRQYARPEMQAGGNGLTYVIDAQFTSFLGKLAVSYIELSQGGSIITSDDIDILFRENVDITGSEAAEYRNAIDELTSELEAAKAAMDEAEAARVQAELERASAEDGRAAAEEHREEVTGRAEAAAGSAEQAASDAKAAADGAREAAASTEAAAGAANDAAGKAGAAAEAANGAAGKASDAADAASSLVESAASTLAGYAEAEAGRAANEQARVEAENARAEAEALRGQAEDAREEAETGRASAESARQSQEAAREEAETGRADAEGARASAEQERAAAQEANDLAQAKNNADQAANNAAAMGRLVRILAGGEYDDTGKPTVGGEAGIIYLVPYTDGEAPDLYAEWIWTGDAWEKIPGGRAIAINPVTTDQTDQIVAGQEVTGDELLNATGLSYYDKAAKARSDAAYDAIGAAAEVDEKVTALTSAVMTDKAAQATKDSEQDTAITAAQTGAEKTAADALAAAVAAQAAVDSAQDVAIQTAQSAAESAQSAIGQIESDYATREYCDTAITTAVGDAMEASY